MLADNLAENIGNRFQNLYYECLQNTQSKCFQKHTKDIEKFSKCSKQAMDEIEILAKTFNISLIFFAKKIEACLPSKTYSECEQEVNAISEDILKNMKTKLSKI